MLARWPAVCYSHPLAGSKEGLVTQSVAEALAAKMLDSCWTK